MAAEHLRVKVKDTGAHITIPRGRWDPDVFVKLKSESPYGLDGLPAAPVYPSTKTPAAASAPASTGHQADSTKENS